MSTAMERVARGAGLPTKASEHRRSAPFVLWFSAPMALLAVAGSLAGILVDTIYSTETENWAAQAVAQGARPPPGASAAPSRSLPSSSLWL
jgi:hypothetical protein